MAKNNLFIMDSQTKEMLQEISATFGVKSSIVESVWQYTIFTMLLKIADKEDGMTKLVIPYIGSIGIRNNGSIMKDGKLMPDLESFVAVSDSFKEMFQKVRNGSFAELSEYIKTNYIDSVIESIESKPRKDK